MYTELLHHVGERIRHYRKVRGLTIDELASKIHKSRGSISKYKRGQITIDVATLFDISQALQVDPVLLIDYPYEGKKQLPKSRNPFGDVDKLYMYNMKGNKIHNSVIHAWESNFDGETMATLYYKVKDFDELENCECMYEGKMQSYDNVLCYTLQNSMNPVENLLLNFFVPMRQFSYLIGLTSGLGANNLLPTCFLVLLSPKPLMEDEQLRKTLTISQDIVKNLKKRNVLTLYPDMD